MDFEILFRLAQPGLLTIPFDLRFLIIPRSDAKAQQKSSAAAHSVYEGPKRDTGAVTPLTTFHRSARRENGLLPPRYCPRRPTGSVITTTQVGTSPCATTYGLLPRESPTLMEEPICLAGPLLDRPSLTVNQFPHLGQTLPFPLHAGHCFSDDPEPIVPFPLHRAQETRSLEH